MARFKAKAATLTLRHLGTDESATFSQGDEVSVEFLPVGRSHIQLMIDAGQIEQVTEPRPRRAIRYMSPTMARIHSGLFRRE